MSLADSLGMVYWSRVLTGLGNGILTSSVYVVEVVTATRRGSVVMVSARLEIPPTTMQMFPVKYWPLALWFQRQLISQVLCKQHAGACICYLSIFNPVLSLDRDCIQKFGSNSCLSPRKFSSLENNCDDSYSTSNICPHLRLFHPGIPHIFVTGEKDQIRVVAFF